MTLLSLAAYEAVLFDMDGLLIDSERVYLECFIESCEYHGFEARPEAYLRCVGTTWQKTREILLDCYGARFPYEAVVNRSKAAFEDRFEHAAVPLKPGAVELLDHLRGQQVVLAVVTSTESIVAARHLARVAIDGYFKILVGGDQVAHSKPAPDIYLRTAGLLDVKPSACLVFEDSENGVLAALAAGMQVIHIPDLGPPLELQSAALRVMESLRAVLVDLGVDP